MKTVLILLLLGFLLLNCERDDQITELSFQEWYIILNGEKVYFTAKENAWVLLVPDTTFIRKEEYLNSLGISKELTYRLYNKVVFRLDDRNKLENIKDELSGFVYISPLFELEGDNYKHSTGELLLNWEKELSDKEIHDIIQKYNLRPIEDERVRWLGNIKLYELMPPYEYHSIELSTYFHENNFTETIEPNFSFILK